MIARLLILLLAGQLLAGCSVFGKKDDEELKPLKLEPIENSVDVRRDWSTRIGGDAENLRLSLSPVSDGNRLYAASFDGRVHALDPEKGRSAWTVDLGEEISAGPSVGEDRIAVMSKDGELIVLDAEDGSEQWRSFVDGESLARPLIRNGTVVIHTIDNWVRAYGLLDGKRRWSIEEPTPALTLRGNASPVAVGNTVIAGFDNGRIIAIDIRSGEVQWQQLLSPPSGRSDLDRLSDVDGVISVVGQDVYAAGYQGRIVSLAAESGQGLWARELSTYAGVYADFSSVYTVLEGGEVVAMSRRTGAELWRNESLLRREPTLPVSFMSTVVTADLEGYLHFFNKETGEPVARLRVSKAAVTAPPVVFANRLYVQSDDGTLSAYVIPEPSPGKRAPDIAGEGE